MIKHLFYFHHHCKCVYCSHCMCSHFSQFFQWIKFNVSLFVVLFAAIPEGRKKTVIFLFNENVKKKKIQFCVFECVHIHFHVDSHFCTCSFVLFFYFLWFLWSLTYIIISYNYKLTITAAPRRRFLHTHTQCNVIATR